ncbi:MAG: lamin tail domain-containing protein [Candidatus Aenigmarchaeota archaeon]|nr:lamin tail domain-containing protein [Candidatus Aenigmarchaeota archaeon]
MKFHLVLIVLLLTACNVQAIVINEIMPDPDDGCWDCSEWIEITSYVNVSLENITVDTGENPITLNGSINAGEFIIITKNSTTFSEIWNPSAIVFECRRMSLHNDGDNITIYNGSEVLQKVEYKSSEKNRSYGLCNQTFVLQNISTPGFSNMCDSEEINETNTTNGTCDLSLTIISDLVFTSGEKHNYYLWVEDENCDQTEKEVKIEYRIEDLFGTIIKSKYITNQSITCYKNISRQWTPREIEGSEACYIKALIIDSACNDSDPSNDIAEKLIVVKGGTPDPGPCPPCETTEETSTCSCGPCPTCISEEETKEEEKPEFEILSCPDEMEKDSEIEIKINLENPSLDKKNYTVYSYIYEGKKPLSLGFNGENWLNTWDANKQNVSIPGNSSLNLTLKNRIANDTEPGKYKLRVRIWLDGKKHDITNDIIIKEPAEPANQTINQTVEKENKTEYNETESDEPESEIHTPTGRVISKDENWFSILIESVINFFKNLFSL